VRDFSLAKAGFTEKPAIEMAGRRTDLKNGACIGVLGSNRISMVQTADDPAKTSGGGTVGVRLAGN